MYISVLSDTITCAHQIDMKVNYACWNFDILKNMGQKNYAISYITSLAFKAAHANIDSTCVRTVNGGKLGEAQEKLGIVRKKKTTNKAEKRLRNSEGLYNRYTELKNLRNDDDVFLDLSFFPGLRGMSFNVFLAKGTS